MSRWLASLSRWRRRGSEWVAAPRPAVGYPGRRRPPTPEGSAGSLAAGSHMKIAFKSPVNRFLRVGSPSQWSFSENSAVWGQNRERERLLLEVSIWWVPKPSACLNGNSHPSFIKGIRGRVTYLQRARQVIEACEIVADVVMDEW